ncbi:MAG TPA: alpha-ketoglutarate-dependent dioxygenase AlkB [Gemmatimonadaceae bacterium]|nr:alpha-ketoglutarate-dependent dioxygenase AlkB [Gemmatimonadaceae bacterium]
MTKQFGFFGDDDIAPRHAPAFPEGFRYQPELITVAEEAALLERVRELPFRDFEFHGYTGKRRVVSFGWHYDFAARRLDRADDIPEFLRVLREPAGEFAGVDAEALQHVLVTEYGPGAAIGWHRDKAVFGEVVGISLLASCVFRLRRATGDGTWERVNLGAEPRSVYLLSGPARSEWEHSIPPVAALRYSITFRNVRDDPQIARTH